LIKKVQSEDLKERYFSGDINGRIILKWYVPYQMCGKRQ
jgi:hypothetical protein